MLSKNQVVKARKAIESMYDGICTIIERQKVKLPNKSTGFKDIVVLEDIPCRLSFKTITNTNQAETGVSAVVQVTKVFIAPEIQVKPGSKLTITQNDVTTEYKSSGQPAIYTTHQEIELELFERWA
nr:MAG TPA: head closure knob [Caudoviricetes sp.]